MKHLITSVTIGACLLLSSAGVVFAAQIGNPHGGAVAGAGGQLGTGSSTGVAGCGPGQPSPSGQALNTTNSPFPAGNPPAPNPTGAVSKYAGAGDGSYGANSPAAPNVNSQYDNACYRAGLRAGTVQPP
jgi:hypothetical protein